MVGVRRWWPGFVALSAIWGASFALIKVAVDVGVPPLWVACWRCVLGAAALWAILALRREPAPRDLATWGHSAVAALLLNAVPFALFSYGETRVSSVLAGVVNATTPLFTLVFAVLVVPGERRPGPRRLAGLGLGFAGVLTLLGVWRGPGPGGVTGGLACLAATCCYGAGFAYLRRHLSGRPHSATGLSAVQIACAAAESALVAPFAAGAPRWPGAGPAAALLALGALGTGVAYILNLTLVRTAGTVVAAAVTYVTPLWSTGLGALLLAEPVGWNALLGGLAVIVAVALTRQPAAPDPAAATAAPAVPAVPAVMATSPGSPASTAPTAAPKGRQTVG
ncbi:DMT family transporter [Streptomyces sp. CB01881]|uniref:DMT family transporter n=1 Tax=Streptomyces sp. CB01881 TaxID=2078691 RepID=UPI0019D59001|nr:DMT family transporter [Streptomyces sp. CB01881]